MTDYNDGKWHGWNGGVCPVHPETIVDVMFRDGSKCNSSLSKRWKWNEDHNGTIIAFRVVKEYREPREFWIVGAHAYDDKDDANPYQGMRLYTSAR